MTEDEVSNLRSGIYQIFWDSGGYSLASVGVTRTGGKWLAPINWVAADNEGHTWCQVVHAVRIDHLMPILE